MIRINQPLIGKAEREAVLAVLDSGQLAQGERVAELERRWAELCGTRFAVAVSSGTAALHLALLAHGIGPGHEVITTPLTFVATANAILLCGAVPVFVDVEPDTLNIDARAIEDAITERTRAILPVHLYGQPCDMEALIGIAEKHCLLLIEDCAQAVGARYRGRPVGSFGTGCFSLYATKNITCGEGGIVTTDSDVVAGRVRLLRHHGQRGRDQIKCLGYNYRLTDLQAALALAQLEQLEDFMVARQYNAAYLSEHITNPAIALPICRPDREHAWHQYTVRFKPGVKQVDRAREEAMAKLAEAGIETRVYYPCPLQYLGHMPSSQRSYQPGSLEQASEASRSILSLPIHPGLSEADLAKIAEEVNKL